MLIGYALNFECFPPIIDNLCKEKNMESEACISGKNCLLKERVEDLLLDLYWNNIWTNNK